MAYQQQTLDRAINPSRGTIYDRNGVELAGNKPVCSISVIHSQITDEEAVVAALCSVLELSEDTVRKKVEANTIREKIKSNVEKETADTLREMKLDGVMIDEDYKRYYPYDNLMAQTLGFVGIDNQGLSGLELKYNEGDNTLTIPTFRQDLGCMADLAEEVARFYGYDNIPVSLPKGEATVGKKPFNQRVDDVARVICERNGFSGGMTYSFESPKVFDKLLLPEDAKERQAIVISNPLGEDFSIMRTVSLNGMLTSLATNYNRRNKVARLYELGNIYLPKALPLTELPEEKMRLTLGMYGDGDFFDLKGVVEELLEKLGVAGAECEPCNDIPYLHPGRQARIMKGKLDLGFLGQVHPEVGDNYNLKVDSYVAVLNMEVLTMIATFDRKYEGIAKFPASTRDLSMVMDKGMFVGQIEHVIKKNAGKILESCELFDVYEGDQVGAGKKSVAFSLSFRAKDRNLESAEVDKAVEKVLAALSDMGIELRS
mgnify:CR=1 FL=1